jgi:hypothetical protein
MYTVKPYDILKAKNSYVTEDTIISSTHLSRNNALLFQMEVQSKKDR